ncbi:TIGR03915 family putative DNA repair protein [Rhodobacter maris]|uniref:DNA polymerase n=1 Tax=Rhodobacter maris TaxID=446682 RepID=A0A285RIL2_9RHOB|nr:TIGR03915 family putative DNA repair protein [Rhodobacter maris]SOB93930.1 DNA polymerase [Rhodobacter maris]
MQVVLPRIGTVAAWRAEARRLAAAGVLPETVLWSVGEAAPDLFAASPAPRAASVAFRLPRVAVESIETALMHADPERFARAYVLVLRLARQEAIWGDRSDPALHRLLEQEKAVRRDIHQMHGFVRFREVTPPGANRRAFAAWFEPAHHILEAAAPFFARRFGDMDWLIATPTLTARFEAGELEILETANRATPPVDATEDLWRVYFANIFNPARLMVNAMTSHMPRKTWKNLPEAALIPDLIRTAPERVAAMRAAEAAAPGPKLQRRLRAISAQREGR